MILYSYFLILTMPKVAILYLLYNGRQYIADCFSSLESLNYPKEQAEIIVVDNKSTDGGLEFFKSEILPKSERELPKITLVENQENAGFAEGNNIGIRLALGAGTDYIYLLNHDTEVEPDFLLKVVELAEKTPEAGSVQSLIFLHSEKNKVNSIGNSIHFLGFGYAGGYGMEIGVAKAKVEKRLKKESSYKIAYSSGAGVLFRIQALREVGLFDPELFLYHEDLDLGWRMRMAGWENILAPESRIYHKYEFSRSIKKYYWMERNRFIVLLKLYRLPTLALLFLALLLGELGLALMSARGGFWAEKVRAYKYFFSLANWRKLILARRSAQKTRKRSDCEIVDLFTSSILFQDFKNPFVLYFVNPILTLYWIIVRALIFW